ncbi:MAG: hypothetical protein OXG67_15090 [bacterium]|nr:hypothetical protein [bacterium]MCY3890760.1 hypothetical protein [bacterium]
MKTALDALRQMEELAEIDPSPQPNYAQVERVLRGGRTAGHVERPDAQAIVHNLRRREERLKWDSSQGGFVLEPLT